VSWIGRLWRHVRGELYVDELEQVRAAVRAGVREAAIEMRVLRVAPCGCVPPFGVRCQHGWGWTAITQNAEPGRSLPETPPANPLRVNVPPFKFGP
jgi:hypothetical protein